MHAITSRIAPESAGRLRAVEALAIAALLAALAQPSWADACNPPSAWPLGHHTFQFRHSGGKLVTSKGFDPAFKQEHVADKAALVARVATYPVGLPGNDEPNDLPRRWTYGSAVTPSTLADAGFPTVTLSGVSGPVYLIDGFNGDGQTLFLEKEVKVVISRSAFAEVRIQSGDTGYAWIVDSLLDQGESGSGFRIFGQNGVTVYVMYSEVLGGDDPAKGRHVAFYRSHLHGPDKAGSEHSDGIQINGGNGTQIIESNVDFLFRQNNGAVYISANNPISNVDVVNSLIIGGDSSIKGGHGSTGNYTDTILICGNRFLATSTNQSWGNGSAERGYPVGNFDSSPPPWTSRGFENNKAIDGSTSGRTTGGNDWNIPATVPVPQAQKNRINADMARMETWVAQIRAASGSPNNPPPPTQPPAPPTPPVLLP